MDCKLLLFDLDGTLLKDDKTISPKTLQTVKQLQKKGIWIGVSTSRSQENSMQYIKELEPDIIISSGGALVSKEGEFLFRAEFTVEETNDFIARTRQICGEDVEITVDTIGGHYWNYKIDPKNIDPRWEGSMWTDYQDFNECSLKMSVEIFEEEKAEQMKKAMSDCDCLRFSDGYWYKFSKKTATKENAIQKLCEKISITPAEITAFGDDFADIGMLKLCGIGVAMGNAIPQVKQIADVVIGSNEEDGIADYLIDLLDEE